MKIFTSLKSWMRVALHVGVVRPFVRLVFGVNATGTEQLKPLDQYIIIANHNSHLDVTLLFSMLPLRHITRVHPVGAYEYFSKWRVLFFVVDYLFRPIWIERGKRNGDPLKEMKEWLARGESVIIFPEGTRGRAGKLAPFKNGIGRLSVEFPDVPIVPVFLLGPERAFPRSSPVPLPLWNEITVGTPRKCTGTHREITQSLQQDIETLAESVQASRHLSKTETSKTGTAYPE
jgi:1-acyl-sn-glycerol-3-phosphate acyltransferase